MTHRYWRPLATILLIAQIGPAWGGYGANPDYPVYPENMEEILSPGKTAVCDAYATPNSHSPVYSSIMDHIDKTYKDGDHRDFFFRYVLTMNCWPFRANFFDHMMNTRNYTQLIGTTMRVPYGGVDPNAYIRIERDGKIIEGPMYHVFEYLSMKHDSNSEKGRKYGAIMRRLDAPARSGLIKNGYAVDDPEPMNSSRSRNASPAGYYLLYPVKPLEEIRREDPAMPINLP